MHAGIKRQGDGFPHPGEVAPPRALLWLRDRDFFENYRGKLVVFGHTSTGSLPNELSTYTPDDPDDLPPGPAGSVRVELILTIDVESILSVTAREPKSGKQSAVTIRPSGGLSQRDLVEIIARRRGEAPAT